MFTTKQFLLAALSLFLSVAIPTFAATQNYAIDPDHTYPSFEADHMGISIWRGKFNKSSGSVQLDKTTGRGTVNISIDMSSVDFGNDKLNAWAMGKEFFDVAKYAHASYQGKLANPVKGIPTAVIGNLTLRGITRPVDLKINSFKCVQHPMLKRDYCGADALVTFKRDEFGLDAGKSYGFNMDVTLRIQVEAIAEPKQP